LTLWLYKDNSRVVKCLRWQDTARQIQRETSFDIQYTACTGKANCVNLKYLLNKTTLVPFLTQSQISQCQQHTWYFTQMHATLNHNKHKLITFLCNDSRNNCSICLHSNWHNCTPTKRRKTHWSLLWIKSHDLPVNHACCCHCLP